MSNFNNNAYQSLVADLIGDGRIFPRADDILF